MEVVLSEPLRRGAPLPLSQLVEESRSQTSIPNPLLQSKIYDKLKGNALIQAEPSELHFSGFELGKEYLKLLKLINVSSEVMNIHIIPTQTKHFQTTYTKKYRLIPGLAYTVKVAFCPNEWRYFYDCIRVHCRGEENLLIPVHAYPVIDDLRIPSRVHLPAVPIGQSVGHTLWLRCSCPIDFEFQVYVIQAHQAFSVHPPSGVIPANGEAKVTVTFTPVEYETCQIIIQLVVSQFNTKPFLCTITGFSAPQLALSQQERKAISEGEASLGLSRVPPAAPPPPRGKPRPPENHRLNNNRLKTVGNPSVVKLPVDVCTPAGVAKMLIRDQHKLSSNGLKEAVRSGSVSALQSREMKAALFLKKVQKKVKEEQTNQLKWQVRLGEDPLSESSRRQILEQREVFLHEYMVKMEDVRLEEDFAVRKPRLSCRRPLREAGQSPDGVPAFQFYTSFHWELRQRPLRRFQQAARKVVLRHRLEKILASLKQLKTFDWKDEESTWDIPPDRVSPSSLRFYTRDDDPLTPVSLEPLPVDPMVSTIKTQVPTFALQVPPHYEVMGCKPASICRAVTPNIPPTPMRPLHTNPPIKPHVASRLAEEEEDEEEEEEDEEEEQQQEGGVASVSFSLPEALLKPFPANRLRIFNPAPGLQVYRSTPTILQTTLESQLRPLTRYIVPERNLCATKTSTEQKIQDREDVIPGMMAWKDFNTLDLVMSQPALSTRGSPSSSRCQRTVCFRCECEERECAVCVSCRIDTLPLSAPPPLTELPHPSALMDTGRESVGVLLTPEMIRKQFQSAVALVSNGNLACTGPTGRNQLEAPQRSEVNNMGRRVMARLKQLEL